MIQVAILNRSTVLADAAIPPVVAALQIQVTRDFAPAWGTDARLTFVPTGGRAAPGAWWLGLLDTSDEAGALGYHDMTAEGLPLGKVFVKSDLQFGAQWPITASHELLEMLADPGVNLLVAHDARYFYAYEDCDAVEADELGYLIDGVPVSDFVHPAWFETFRKPGAGPFDHRGHCDRPFQLLRGGYAAIFDARRGRWTQRLAQDSAPHHARPRVGSRRERRAIERELWQASRAEA